MQVDVGFEANSFFGPLFDFLATEEETATPLPSDDPSKLQDGVYCIFPNAPLGHPHLGVTTLDYLSFFKRN